MNVILEKAFAKAILIQTSLAPREEVATRWNNYKAEATNDPEKAFVLAVGEPFWWMYFRESKAKNAKIFIKVIKRYYEQWCDDKLGFQIPVVETINDELSVYDKVGIENKPMDIKTTRKYWKRIVTQNELDTERPRLFNPSKRRRLKRTRSSVQTCTYLVYPFGIQIMKLAF
ncbi:uncharacterized protein J8A68_001010 [[Candida] subhashii]|uniref:Uncharacterized protein n=1 Tax=[Candida] subhashii TaxID=561895 RepID=A0A8J5QLJ0_9ASCO|nr:uncharacterized protein J8A68_001010 [[Candida] subhashii]KAG7665322.1 hypothetical protein J8A68_001010 [[Candida] subhashii]